MKALIFIIGVLSYGVTSCVNGGGGATAAHDRYPSVKWGMKSSEVISAMADTHDVVTESNDLVIFTPKPAFRDSYAPKVGFTFANGAFRSESCAVIEAR